MIPEPTDFESAWESLMTGDFVYNGSETLRAVVKRNVLSDDRGVYVIRNDQLDVIYIGMTGTVTQLGNFKGQGLLGRLTNTRGKGESAQQWFDWLISNHDGQIRIEFAYCTSRMSPRYIESFLLHAYLNDFGNLPAENKAL